MAFGYYCLSHEDAQHLRKVADNLFTKMVFDDEENEAFQRWEEIGDVLSDWAAGRITYIPTTTKGVSHA
jgi:hypothetical protein